jgi:hypothetical protein
LLVPFASVVYVYSVPVKCELVVGPNVAGELELELETVAFLALDPLVGPGWEKGCKQCFWWVIWTTGWMYILYALFYRWRRRLAYLR